jgi:hypothetical protein
MPTVCASLTRDNQTIATHWNALGRFQAARRVFRPCRSTSTELASILLDLVRFLCSPELVFPER